MMAINVINAPNVMNMNPRPRPGPTPMIKPTDPASRPPLSSSGSNTCLASGPARQKPSIVDALNATRWMAKQRPCRPAGTLVCQSELLDAEMTGIIRNKMKPATATSVTEGHIPSAAMHTPARSEKASTPWIRFRGPPHAVMATPPSSNPKPLIAYCTPSRVGSENDKTNGATITQAMENRNLLEPYTANNPIRPGLSCT